MRDADAFDQAIDVIGTLAARRAPRGRQGDAPGARREAHRPPRPGERLDLAHGRVHARGPRGVRGPALAGDQAAARPAGQLVAAARTRATRGGSSTPSRKQDRRLAAALLAAALAHTPEAEEVLRGARTRMARKPTALARELLRNFPKGRRGRGRRRRKKGEAERRRGPARRSQSRPRSPSRRCSTRRPGRRGSQRRSLRRAGRGRRGRGLRGAHGACARAGAGRRGRR